MSPELKAELESHWAALTTRLKQVRGEAESYQALAGIKAEEVRRLEQVAGEIKALLDGAPQPGSIAWMRQQQTMEDP